MFKTRNIHKQSRAVGVLLGLALLAGLAGCSKTELEQAQDRVREWQSHVKNANYKAAWDCFETMFAKGTYVTDDNFRTWAITQNYNGQLGAYTNCDYHSQYLVEPGVRNLYYSDKPNKSFTLFQLRKLKDGWFISDMQSHLTAPAD